MTTPPLHYHWLTTDFAICRFAPDAPVPTWAAAPAPPAELISVTRTHDELSIIAPAAAVPADVQAEQPYHAARIAGPLDFAMVGVLARLTGALADADVPVFALSTYDTDYLLVREADVARASAAFTEAGMTIE